MPSNYAAFEVKIDNDNGTTSPVPGQTIDVWNITGEVTLGTLTSDGDGHVASGTLAVAVGTHVRFSFHKTNGQCGFAEVVTT